MIPYKLIQTAGVDRALKKILPMGCHSNLAKKDNATQLHFTKGRGSRIWDIDGNEYLDLYGKSGALLLGHNHPKYNIALKNCIDNILAVDLIHNQLDIYQKMCIEIPCCEMVRFGLSGTEMIQNAIRLARAYTGKNKILTFEGHYHGNADNIMGGHARSITEPFTIDDKDDFYHTYGRARNILEEQKLIIPWNDLDAFLTTITKFSDDIAAVIMEPICINGGGIEPDIKYLENIHSKCHERNIVLIFDEVITGLRLGLGGAQKLLGITPDLAVFSKCLGGGIPLAALIGKKDIMKLYENGYVIHGGTFNGYPLGLAALKSVWSIMEEPDNYVNMNKYAAIIHSEFLKQAKELGLELIIQGPLACSCFHVGKQLKNSSELTTDIIYKNGIIRECMKQYGILIAHTSRLYMNISFNDTDVDFFRDRIGYALYDAKCIFDRLDNKVVKFFKEG